MTWSENLERLLAQSRDLQRSLNEAANKTAEQIQPLVRESLKNAHELQDTLAKHASETGEIAAEQSKVAIGHLQEYIKIGSEAIQHTTEQTRAAAEKLADQSRKVAESAKAAIDQGLGGGTPRS